MTEHAGQSARAAAGSGALAPLPTPYLLFLGDATEPAYAKTALGLRDWIPERCIGEWGCAEATVSTGLPRLTPAEAYARGARGLVIGVANVGGVIAERWVPLLVGTLALLVVANVPFALVGGIAALWVRGMNLNLSASIGFIALFGVAMLNGVVLVSSINQLREAGAVFGDAVIGGARRRLRPVLMTAFVASFGFIPMALSTSTGAEVQRPLASVVIGGVVSSTMLTLFLLPVLYSWFVGRRPASE